MIQCARLITVTMTTIVTIRATATRRTVKRISFDLDAGTYIALSWATHGEGTYGLTVECESDSDFDTNVLDLTTQEPTTAEPTSPTFEPTEIPTAYPSFMPSNEPSVSPTTAAPTQEPTTGQPTPSPSVNPSTNPSVSPSM